MIATWAAVAGTQAQSGASWCEPAASLKPNGPSETDESRDSEVTSLGTDAYVTD